MKKFDADNLSLSNIIILLIPATVLLLIWLWIASKQFDFDGARGLAVDRNGVTHIQVGETLHRYDDSGAELSSIDLHELGVVDFIGDLSFNAANELVVRRGRYETGFLEQLAIFLRVSNKNDTHAIDGEGLSLCDLNSMQCREFGESSHDFNRGFFSVINQLDETIVISDASRHELHKFDREGRHLASLKQGLKFPNEMVVDQNQLYLVDTNHKAVKQLTANTEDFGVQLNAYIVANSDAEERGHTWPFVLEKVNENWWVVMLDSNMDKGGVYIFDENWDYMQSLPLESNAVPVALLNTQGYVLMSDLEGDKVSRYAVTGELVGAVEHVALNEHLTSNLSKRQFYRKIGISYFVFIIIVFFIAFAYAFRQSKVTALASLEEQGLAEQATELDIENDGQMVEWIEPRSQLRSLTAVKKIQTFGLCALIMIFGISVFYIRTYIHPEAGLEGIAAFAPFFLFGAGVLLLMTDGARVRLGIYNNMLVLHDQLSNEAFMASGHTVLYDGRRIAFGALSLQTGAMAQPLYDNVSFTKKIFPLLAEAHVVKPNAMQMWQVRYERKRWIEMCIKVLVVVLAICVISFTSLIAEGASIF